MATRLVAFTSRSARLDWIEAIPNWRRNTLSTKSLLQAFASTPAWREAQGQALAQKRPDLHALSRYKMPGGVPMAWFSLAFLRFVLCLLALRPDTRLALCVMPGWFIWLAIAYPLSTFRASPFKAFEKSVASGQE